MMKEIKTRKNAEASESLETKVVDAPQSRFQTEQQVAKLADTQATPEASGFIPKKVKSAGQTLRTEKVAEVLAGAGAGGPGAAGVASPAAFGLKAAQFSGDTGTILGNASGTPSMGTSFQGNTRIDKRISDANKDINFNASEQIMVEYDAIPPLAASESTVGMNGNPKNTAARSQKKTGFTSAEIVYDRSLDFIEKDAFVYSSGQVVAQYDTDYDAYNTLRYDDDGNVMLEDSSPVHTAHPRGNFSPRELKVKFNSTNGRAFVSAFEVLEDDLSCNDESDIIVNASATNHLIDLNRAELTRQTIDADAGSPTAEHFNPLGRSVAQPTGTVTYLQDIENVTGAEVFTAYKFANKARAHFLSRTAKDGQDLIGPALDALYGHLAGVHDMGELYTLLDDRENESSLFSISGMKAGSAAILIPIFDSMGKYRTKGDLVNQPRGLKLHLQTADNNMDPFRCKKEFVAALNSIDAYSTIDHEYDPTAPVYITDNVRLVHPYSWANSLKFTRSAPGAKSYESPAWRYAYNAGSGMNSYLVTMGEPVLNGVAYFLDQHAQAIYRALGGNGEVELTIPIVHSTTHFSLWDLMVCASTPYIIWERTNTMKDILDYEMFYKYPFTGNVRIQDANPLNAVNYGTISPYSQMQTKVMLPSSAIRWKYPEVFLPLGQDVLAPWYFNEASYTLTGDAEEGFGRLRYNGSANFTTPVVRSGLKLGGLDDFFGMEVKDQLLITDRMVRLPNEADMLNHNGYIYKYSQDADGIPVLMASAIADTTARDVYSTPRLLGYYADAPAGVCQCYGGALTEVDDEQVWIADFSGLTALDEIRLQDMRPSFRAIQYKGVYGSGEVIVDRPLQVGSINVNRAQAFTQMWAAKWAGAEYSSKYFDLVLSINEAMEFNDEAGTGNRFVTLNNRSQFSPFVYSSYHVTGTGSERRTTNTAYEIEDLDVRPIVFSPHYMLWTLLQKTCFVFNPFENSDRAEPAADPFGVAYLFGLAGFVAANYDEELYNRANAYQNEGYGYTSDPMISASPIFKDAYAHTEIG